MENMLKKHIEDRPIRDLRGKMLKKSAKRSQLTIVRYADDFVEVIQECEGLVAEWLKPMGLALRESRKGHTFRSLDGKKSGFNFLGFNIRQYAISKYKIRASKLKLPFRTLIKPQRERTKLHIRELCRTISGSPKIEVLIAKTNPLITGWARYYRSAVSYRIFKWCDTWLYRRLFRWACKKHPKRPRTQIRAKYFLSKGNRNWVFAYTTNSSQMISISQHYAIPIERHVKVQSNRSPYDGDWPYWGSRLAKYGVLSKEVSILLKKQKARCAWCKLPFLTTDVMERDHCFAPLSKGGAKTLANLQLLHGHCHDEKTASDSGKPE